MNDSSALSQPAHPSSRTPESGSLEVGALVLAAGFSRRFGATKLLAALPENQQISLFEQTLINLCMALPTIVVVYRPELRTQFHEIRDSAAQHYPGTVITLVEFKQAESGMGGEPRFWRQPHYRLGCRSCLSSRHALCHAFNLLSGCRFGSP